MGQKGHDPLVILSGQPIEFLFRDGLEEQIVLFDHLHEFLKVTAFSLLEKDRRSSSPPQWLPSRA